MKNLNQKQRALMAAAIKGCENDSVDSRILVYEALADVLPKSQETALIRHQAWLLNEMSERQNEIQLLLF